MMEKETQNSAKQKQILDRDKKENVGKERTRQERITYIYNDFYWDNGLAKHLLFSAFCLYFFGVWLISLIMIMSSWVDNSAAVSIGTCGIFVACYMLSMIPKLQEYLPTKLMACSKLPFGVGEPSDYVAAIAVMAVWSVANIVIGIIIFNKKNL